MAKVVKATVRASSKLPEVFQTSQKSPKVVSAVMTLMKKIRNLRSKSKTGWRRGIGFSDMTSDSSGSWVKAKLGKPSVTKLIQIIWAGKTASGQPSNKPKPIISISAKLSESRYSTSLRMLSKITRQ